MLWIQLASWSLVALGLLHQDRRWRGDAGRRRLLELAVFLADGVRSAYRSPWPTRMFVAASVLLLGGALAFAVIGDWLSAAAGAVGGAANAVAARSRTHTAPHVLAVLDERDLSMAGRETSRLRRLRSRQYGMGALVAYAVGVPFLIVGVREDATALTAAGGVLLSLGTIALAALAWAAAWRYGDEQPAPEPDRDA